MLPSYLTVRGFFEKNKRINFGDCGAYKDNNSDSLLKAQVPFNVEFAQDIEQQSVVAYKYFAFIVFESYKI